jgi:hypothetical protein
MTTMVSLRRGHDVRYFTNHGGAGGCAGAMAYYTKAGEPPDQWAGKLAVKLGLRGEVDPQVLDRLFMDNIGPGGDVLAKRHRARGDELAEQREVRAYRKKHPYASATEIGEFRASLQAKALQRNVPYFDLTVSAVKSVSVLHASYRVAAMLARGAGRIVRADALDARADAIEHALMDAARDAIAWLENQGSERDADGARIPLSAGVFTRTGYHSSTTGEWRDGDGLAASLFLHHLSRDGDPQLHVHVAFWNRTLRGDGADDKYRTLFGRPLFNGKIGLAPVPDRFLEARLRQLGYVMETREDGNGCEVTGVSKEAMRQFSSRGVSIGPELAKLAAEYERVHSKPPSRRTLWLLHQQAGQRTRRTKAEARRTVNGTVHDVELSDAERLAEWEAATSASEMAALSEVYEEVERVARTRAHERSGDRIPVAPPDPPDGALPSLPRAPDYRLADFEKRRAARIAVAEVQKHHAAWGMAALRFEIHRALPPGVSSDDVTEIAALVVSGRAGADVVQIGAGPDIADVSPLGVRTSDGMSVYRPPVAELWCTVDHLNLEDHVVTQAKAARRQLVPESWAREQVAKTELNADQAEMVVQLLTAARMTIPVNAAAGSGKSHALGVFSRLWTTYTGGRVIGLTTSTNASRVLRAEMDEAGAKLAESYNIAQFVGKIEGSDELRWPVPVHEGDVIVLDEATQASTADFALVQQAARHAGAFLHPIGDTAQLGAVEAGGIFHLLVEDLGGPELTEILRFRHQWERDASLRIRAGQVQAVDVYDRRGRVRGADTEAAMADAAKSYLSDLLRGRDVLLLAGSNGEAAELARQVQGILRMMGRVGEGQVELSDGNIAGEGDWIRARLNASIDAGGQLLTNRDTLRVVQVAGPSVVAQRKTGPEAWSAQFAVPAAYLAENAELDYAGNAHVAQGRTVDIGHLLVSQTLSRRGLYVGMTRGRYENFAHVETGNTAPPGKPAYEQATVEAVIKGVMEREASEMSATEQLRAAQEWAGGSGHVLHLWSETIHRSLYPQIDREVMARLTRDQAHRYVREFARTAFHTRLREAQLAGHDIGELIARVTADSLDGARSISSVLHSRLAGLGLSAQPEATWDQRTPDGAPELARELAAGLDDRARALGVHAAERPQPWLLDQLGALASDASPTLRADYERRAGIAASYREAAGITNPRQAVAVEPHAGNPELETFRQSAMNALEIRDEAVVLRSMTIGQLEAQIAEGDRAMAAAPPDISADLRLAAQAQADAWAQHADAQARDAHAEAVGARDLAGLMGDRQVGLEPMQAAYERWSSLTADKREAAGKAAAELARRQAEHGAEPGGLADWWRAFEADAEAAEQAIAAQHQAAVDAAAPWPPERAPEVEAPDEAERPEAGWWQVFEADAEAAEQAIAAQHQAAVDAGVPWPAPHPAGPETVAADPARVDPLEVASNEPAASVDPEPEPETPPRVLEEAERAARLDEIQACAKETAARIRADADAEAQASEDYAVRQSQAQAEPGAQPDNGWQVPILEADMEPEA